MYWPNTAWFALPSSGKLAGGVSQKMLTKTVRQMESDGLVKRTVHPWCRRAWSTTLTDLGQSLGEAFCGVWLWAEKHYDAVEQRARGVPRKACGLAEIALNGTSRQLRLRLGRIGKYSRCASYADELHQQAAAGVGHLRIDAVGRVGFGLRQRRQTGIRACERER